MRRIMVLMIACCAPLLGACGDDDSGTGSENTTRLEPDVVEYKYYASNVGPVLRTNAEGGGREELVSFTEE
jgi:hypothetical protein